MRISGVLFDLDGTLLDTAPDFAYCINKLLEEEGKDPLPCAVIRDNISAGSLAMIQAAFPAQTEEKNHSALQARLLEMYAARCTVGTRPYFGTMELLDTLEQHGLTWGIVTNKPERFTTPLVETLGLAERAKTIISGDTLAKAKPNPEPLLAACTAMQLSPDSCVMIGDAATDITAAKRAGMRSVIAGYGYIAPDVDLLTWGANFTVSAPQQIFPWLQSQGIRLSV